MACDRDDVRVVAGRILAYFERNPTAADTADGIRTWWLADEPVAEPSVRAALKWLVDQRLVDASNQEPPVYSIARNGNVTH